MKDNHPLVSICVITYNSSKYILETLNSIEQQTYKNIELIISDDCSNDKTVDICQEWLDSHKERFIKTLILRPDKNTGISANCNRAYKAASGIWIKGIAGDDYLYPNAIETYINFINNASKTPDIIFAKVCPVYCGQVVDVSKIFKYSYFELTPKEFQYLLLTRNFLPAASSFLNKEYFIKSGGFDENIPMMEDWPFWIKSVCNNASIVFIDSFTVYYRVSSTSTSQERNEMYSCSEHRARELSLSYQKRISKLLWLYSNINMISHTSTSLFIKACMRAINLINPMTLYLFLLRKKADHKGATTA